MRAVQAQVLYLVEIIEFERGWGQRPEGYLAFLNESEADNYIVEETKDRVGSAPDVYWNYYKIGYQEANRSNIQKVKKSDRKRIYIDKLKELLE